MNYLSFEAWKSWEEDWGEGLKPSFVRVREGDGVKVDTAGWKKGGFRRTGGERPSFWGCSGATISLAEQEAVISLQGAGEGCTQTATKFVYLKQKKKFF